MVSEEETGDTIDRKEDRMSDLYCETCPVRGYYPTYKRAREDNENGYHHQAVLRVWDYDNCPLMRASGLNIVEGKRLSDILENKRQTERRTG